MAAKDSKTLKGFLIIYGILLIMVGVVLSTLSLWQYIGGLQYLSYPGYVIGGGTGVLIIGLSALLASREPAKHIKVIDGLIIFNILIILFICTGLHMLRAFDIYSNDSDGILDFFLLLPFYLRSPANILPIIFIIILIAIRPKKGYKARRAMAAKEPNTTLKVFFIIYGIYIITKGALFIFINSSLWHSGYVIGMGIGILIIGLSVLLASREPAKHTKVIDLIIIISILIIIFYFIVFFSYIHSEIGFDNFFKDIVRGVRQDPAALENHIILFIYMAVLNIFPIIFLIISISLRLKQGRLKKQLSN
jgi:hypothetical protein